MESAPREEMVDKEFREKVTEKIKFALDNALTESRFRQLQKKYAKGLSNGMAPEDKKAYEEEILKSTVLADNLVEYKEVLLQVETLLHEEEGWAMANLAHENAHVNVGESLGFELIGYSLLFVKNKKGKLLGVQPNCIMRPQAEWTEDQYHQKQIEMLDAPRVYGETLSESDIDQIKIHKRSISE